MCFRSPRVICVLLWRRPSFHLPLSSSPPFCGRWMHGIDRPERGEGRRRRTKADGRKKTTAFSVEEEEEKEEESGE